MIKSTVEKMAHHIGFEVGTSDDNTQSDLLNGFCKGLRDSILENKDLDMQICHIVEGLDQKSRDILKRIAEFIEIK